MSISDRVTVDDILNQMQRKAGSYEWTEAADLCGQVLVLLDPSSNAGEIARTTEFLAKCHLRQAFQSESRSEFEQRLRLAEAEYQKAAILHENQGLGAFSKRSRSRGLFAHFWLEQGTDDRRKILSESIRLSDEAAKIFEGLEDKRNLAETYNDILTYYREALVLATDWESINRQFQDVVQLSRKASNAFERLGEDEGLLECLSLSVWLLAVEAEQILEPSAFQAYAEDIRRLGRQLAEVSQRIGTPYAVCLAKEAAGDIAFDLDGDCAEALKLYEEGALAARRINDSLILGRLLAAMAQASDWLGATGEYWDRRREFLAKGLEHASNAIKSLEISSHTTSLAASHASHASILTTLGVFVETEVDKKKAHLSKAVEIARRGTLYESRTWAWSMAANALSKAMYFLATIEPNHEEKSRLLREALPIREETVRAADLLLPHFWSPIVMRNYLALIRAELSTIEHKPEAKVALLQGAVSDMQECLDLGAKWATNPGFMQSLARYGEYYGDILLQLYQLTKAADIAKLAVNVYHDAIAYLIKAELIGPLPTVRWKIARVHDAVADYKEASDAFRRAAEDYRLGAKKIPGSASVFAELASYMESWSSIEEARLHHNEEQFLLAAEKYAKAGATLESNRSWNYLSKHYAACSFLEGGEALSRQERQDASVESFTVSVKTFREAKTELEKKLRHTQIPKEKQELENWIRVTEARERYGLGRMELESAKVLDMKGEEEASGSKYRSATEIFGRLLAEAEDEQGRRELHTLVLFSEAWALMKEAETRASPDLYAEAADLFTKAEKVVTRKKFRLLALANASMCRALESGARFRRARNIQLYSEIKKQLETAGDYYQEAGFQTAACWTHATQRYFDSLVYMASAETEIDPKKKTEFYHFAEKHLELAARLYGEAGFSSKRDEAHRHLVRARQEKQILLTPVEALTENPALTGVTVQPLSLVRDQAVGLERFEAASVVGSFNLPRRELHVGTDITLQFEILNAGKTTAMLVKLENVAPQGLELEREAVEYRVEDGHLNMRGKRLEYLKTHEMKVRMRATRKGSFELRPKIFFVDEKGNQGSYEFEPANLTVTELGISGWLKGPK